jgi:hypothetical protein
MNRCFYIKYNHVQSKNGSYLLLIGFASEWESSNFAKYDVSSSFFIIGEKGGLTFFAKMFWNDTVARYLWFFTSFMPM